MSELVAERQAAFAEAYENFEASDVIKLVVATGEWLERLVFQPEAADAAMKALYQVVIGRQDLGELQNANWRDLWNDLPSSSEYDAATSQYFVSLNGFAHYGLRPDGMFFDAGAGSEEDVVVGLKDCIAAGRGLLDAVPSGWAKVDHMTSTILAAEGRLALDLGLGITVEQLAALARVNVKSIRNLLTPKGGVSDLRLTAAGLIQPGEALRYLKKRPAFFESIWRENPDVPLEDLPAVAESLGEVVFVPVAKDGSTFDPVTCFRVGRYTIGPKGAERDLTSYRGALMALASMPTPYWRRRNGSGHWGIVSGAGWQRRPVSELATPEGAVA